MSVAESRNGQVNGRLHTKDFPRTNGQASKPYEHRKVLPGSPEYEANTRYIKRQIEMMREWDKRNPNSSRAQRRPHTLEND